MRTTSTKVLLGARIKELRKRRGWTQDQVAERTGIDPKHLSRLEVGAGFPSLDTLERLARVLRVDLKDFFEYAHQDHPHTLRAVAVTFVNDATDEQLRLIVKLLRAVTR
ncbi:MAG: helix-turn-helix transcriptional regulator [Nitrospirota bacterium]